jgi:hypothetical protein
LKMTEKDRVEDEAAKKQTPSFAPPHNAPSQRPTPEMVRLQLQRLLASPRFQSSPRCQAFLQYVVEEALNGRAESLKERNLGVAVFKRDPSYDTNGDPVVRMAAGEVRKKLAQHYCQPANQGQIWIELPTGAYTPEFRLPEGFGHAVAAFSALEDAATATQKESSALPDVSSAGVAYTPPGKRRFVWGAVAVSVVVVVAMALVLYARLSQDAFSAFWAPITKSSEPVLLCVGQMQAERVHLNPNISRNPYGAPMPLGPGGVYPKEMAVAVLPDAVTMANLVGILREQKKDYRIRGEAETSLADLERGPSVLIGAYNNDWSILFTKSMRFNFILDVENSAWWISDQQKPGGKIGYEPISQHWRQSKDYALVARVFNQQTHQPTVMIAGILPYGTSAAGEFISNPVYLDAFAKTAPKGWLHRNMEILISTNIVGAEAGPPHVEASFFW